MRHIDVSQNKTKISALIVSQETFLLEQENGY